MRRVGSSSRVRGAARRASATLAVAVLGAVGLVACSDDADDAGERYTGEGLVELAEVTAGPNSVLSAELTVETSAPVTTSVVARGGDRDVEVASPPEASDSQRLPILGLQAETTYDVELVASDDSGTNETVELSFTTEALPDDFPPLRVDVSAPERMAPGVTLFNAGAWDPPDDEDDGVEPEPREHNGLLLAVDEAGELVWYYRTTLGITDVSVTERGTLLVSVHDALIREIDMLGNTLREWGTLIATDYVREDPHGNPFASDVTEPIAVDSAHHELYELASGNTLTISTKLVELPDGAGATLCPDDPAEVVVADVIVELDPDGEVVAEWPLDDYFDPVQRPGAEMCVNGPSFAPPNWFYPEVRDVRDWTHANAAVVDERTNTLMVSMRHLDSVIGIRYRDDESGPAGELKWDLSEDGTLTMLGDGEWPRHQHAVEPQEDGTILLYDNGNNRPGTTQAGGDAPPYSRAVQYRVDEEAGTVEQIWEHRDVTDDGTPQFAGFLSDADRLANGNVLVTHGAVTTEDGVLYARLVEVAPGADGADNEVVFDVLVGDRESLGWTVYRAERLPSLTFGEANDPG